jgi:hypothetical protein
VNNRFAHTRYELKRQFWKLAGANVRVFDPQGNLAFFAHQKAWKLKEDFRIYGDEAKTIELIRIGARKILDFSGTYDVFDGTTNEKIGAFKRKGMKSAFLRDNWILMDAQDREVGQIIENQALLAFLRRWVELVAFLSPQSYDFEVQGRKGGGASAALQSLHLQDDSRLLS